MKEAFGQKTPSARLVFAILCHFAMTGAMAYGVTLSAGDRERYGEVFAPRVVAELPCQEASYTMCMMPDGRIRFYGWQWISGARRRAYIESFRQSLQSRLDNTYIVDHNGNKRKLERKQ